MVIQSKKRRNIILSFVLYNVLIYHSYGNSESDQEWRYFIEKFKMSFKNQAEENTRYTNWKERLDYIRQHNQLADDGIYNYRLSPNKFSDKTLDYIKLNYLTDLKNSENINYFIQSKIENTTFPDYVDWRESGCVTPVKDQMTCGSCWAFCSVAAMETQHCLHAGDLIQLSEQNLVDCSWPQGNMGCSGGEMKLAFEYVKGNLGIDTEESYPYEDKDGLCRYKGATTGASIRDYRAIEKGNELEQQKAVALIGPVAASIDASHAQFLYYSNGIYENPLCGNEMADLNHAVTIIGYGTEGDKDYWLVKNSWGESWGQGGFGKVARNKDNHCGIATQSSYPLYEPLPVVLEAANRGDSPSSGKDTAAASSTGKHLVPLHVMSTSFIILFALVNLS